MIFVGHIVLFVVFGGAVYGVSMDRTANWPTAVMLTAPIVGVYFLGWWALATVAVAWIAGSKTYVDLHVLKQRRDDQDLK